MVCQPSGSGSIPGMSRSETAVKGEADNTAATHNIFVYYMLIYTEATNSWNKEMRLNLDLTLIRE